MSGVFRIIAPPPPHRPASVYPPPLVRGEDTLAGWRRGGGSIARKTPDTALYSIYVSTLWTRHYILRSTHIEDDIRRLHCCWNKPSFLIYAVGDWDEILSFKGPRHRFDVIDSLWEKKLETWNSRISKIRTASPIGARCIVVLLAQEKNTHLSFLCRFLYLSILILASPELYISLSNSLSISLSILHLIAIFIFLTIYFPSISQKTKIIQNWDEPFSAYCLFMAYGDIA